MTDINFDEIIITGFDSIERRDNLMSYFVSKSKEAKRYYDRQYFFDSCLVTMKKYETQVKEKYYDKKAELETNIRNRKENNNLEDVSKIENEIRELSISNSSIEIKDIIPYHSGPLTGKHIVRIKKNIYSAFYKECPNECMEMAIRESKECLPDEVLQEMPNTFTENADNLSETQQTESEKYKKSITISKIATAEDVEQYPGLEIGQKFELPLPLPKDRDELFEQFEKLYAQRYFEAEQVWFYDKYGRNACREIVEDALKQNKTFIQKAKSLSVGIAFDNKKQDDHYEFLRLKHGYYTNENRPFIGDVYYYYNPNAIYVYATYFLYKEWLESELNKLKNPFKIDYLELKKDLENIEEIESTDEITFNRAMNEFEPNNKFIIWKDGNNARRFTKLFFNNDRLIFNKYFRIMNSKKKLIKMRTNHVGDITNAPTNLKEILERWQKK